MRHRLRPLCARSTVAHLCALAVCAALGRESLAADVYYLGAQYTPGPSYPAPWPTEGSWFDKNLWQNNTLPSSSDVAFFGSAQSMPNGNTAHAPHTLHFGNFGNFGYFGTTTIAGGTQTLSMVSILTDAWTFDFGSAQNPEFTGTLTRSTGALSVGTVSLTPLAGQTASLTLQNGSLTARTLSVSTNFGSSLLTLAANTYLNTAYSTIGDVGNGSLVQTGGTHTVSDWLMLGARSGTAGIYSLVDGRLVGKSEDLGYSGTGTFTQTGGTHTVTNLNLGNNAGSVGSYTLSGGQVIATSGTVGLRGLGSFTQTGGTYAISGTLALGYSSGGSGVYNLSGGLLAAAKNNVGVSGTSSLVQTGGTQTLSDALSIGAQGLYSLTGGTLQVTGGLDNAGSLVLGGNATLLAAGIVYLSRATAQDLSQFALTLAPKSLLVLPAEIPPSAFGTFTNNGGLIATAGSPAVIPAGAVVTAGSVICPGMLVCSGTLTGTARLRAIQVQDAAATATAYSLITDSPDSSLVAGQLTLSTEGIGYSGAGAFTQSGGIHNLSQLTLGSVPGASGAFNLSGGELKAAYLDLGYGASGSFAQSGGTHTVSSSVTIGRYAGAQGIYTLTDGRLTAPSKEYLGRSGSGTFAQSGGTHAVSGTLFLGYDPGAAGVYTLDGGTLTATLETVGAAGSGTFTQTAGLHSLGTLNIGPLGSYSLAGGTLALTGGLANTGTLAIAGTTTLTAAGMIDLSGVDLQDVGHVSVTLGAASILILPAGATTALFGSFASSSDAIVANAGTPLTIPAGKQIPAGGGGCMDLVICAGTLTGAANLYGGIQLPTAASRATIATLRADNAGSSLAAGSLGSGPVTIGQTAGGTFAQSGGTFSISGAFTLGNDVTASGVYLLSNGYLGASSGNETIGYAGTGSFAQSGGTHTVASAFYLGSLTGASGTYALSGGSLKTQSFEYLGYSGNGSFTQTGGTHTATGTLTLGYNAGAAGSYSLSNGLLSTVIETLGYSGAATFTQSGGTHTASNIRIGQNASAVGTYTLSNGQLTGGIYIGDSGTGMFIHTGGTVNGALWLGSGSSGVGFYTLEAGQLNGSTEYIGVVNSGSFTQNGGTNVSSQLWLGLSSYTAVGTYVLNDGQMTSVDVMIGGMGTGRFIQNGGTHTVSGSLALSHGPMSFYELSAGLLSVSSPEDLNGNFTQSGGTHTITSTLTADFLYTLTAGRLTAAQENVGGPLSSTGTVIPRQFVQSGGTHTVSGTLAIAPTVSHTGIFALSGAGILNATSLFLGGSSTAAGGTGTLAISGGTATVTNTLKLWNTSNTTLTLSGGTLAVGTLTLVNPYKFSWTAGTLLVNTGTVPAITVPTAGAFRANATVTGTLTNNGIVAPGNSIGTLTVQGKYSQSAAATLELEIAGAAATQFDRLIVQNALTALTLAGTIDVNFLPAYTPAPGDTFDLLDWTGTFTNNGYRFDFTHAPLTQGLAWDTSRFSTTGQLTIIAAPEPTSLILLSLGSLSLVHTRRRVPRLRRTQLVPCRRGTEP